MRVALSKISVSLAGALALFLCFTMMTGVPKNTAIRNPQPTMTILWLAVAVIIVTGFFALIRSSKKSDSFLADCERTGDFIFTYVVMCLMPNKPADATAVGAVHVAPTAVASHNLYAFSDC
jgi:hypothetical protein